MSLTAEPTGRRASASRSHATTPVVTSSTIACRASIADGQSRASAAPGATSNSAAAASTAVVMRATALTGAA